MAGLKRLDNFVAMTGDSTSDAPALKKADIGFAMGISGTETVKEISSIILLNDNFKSIVIALKYSRNILVCIRKYLQFYLTASYVTIITIMVGVIFLG